MSPRVEMTLFRFCRLIFAFIYTDGPDAVSFNPTDQSYSAEEGSSYTVSCSCAECVPSCTAQWNFHGQSRGSGGSLAFSDVLRGEAGDYTCTCTNEATSSKTKTKTFSLTVRCKY